jgi:hypothetical protein
MRLDLILGALYDFIVSLRKLVGLFETSNYNWYISKLKKNIYG